MWINSKPWYSPDKWVRLSTRYLNASGVNGSWNRRSWVAGAVGERRLVEPGGVARWVNSVNGPHSRLIKRPILTDNLQHMWDGTESRAVSLNADQFGDMPFWSLLHQEMNEPPLAVASAVYYWDAGEQHLIAGAGGANELNANHHYNVPGSR